MTQIQLMKEMELTRKQIQKDIKELQENESMVIENKGKIFAEPANNISNNKKIKTQSIP